MSIKTQPTIEDLHRVPESGKAEIVNGELRLMSPTGDLLSRAGLAIVVSLTPVSGTLARADAIPNNAAFFVDLPNRRSFTPDAAYYIGHRSGGKFLVGAPVFAAEVRSESDYGPAAEREMAAKRHDYFAAGTLVVWDVDVLRDDLIRVYPRVSLTTLKLTAAANSPSLNPPCPAGRFRLKACSSNLA